MVNHDYKRLLSKEIRSFTYSKKWSLPSPIQPFDMIRRKLQIKENFGLYETLLAKPKSIDQNSLVLAEKGNGWRESNTQINHNSLEFMTFCAAKKVNGQKYGLKIFVKLLIEEPVIYFDSDGPAHCNYNGKTRLSAIMVKTPHINYYDEEGYPIARRATYVEENESALQSDMNTGMNFFCEELNLNMGLARPTLIDGEIYQMFVENDNDVHDGVDFFAHV
jgi:hypothetical protein